MVFNGAVFSDELGLPFVAVVLTVVFDPPCFFVTLEFVFVVAFLAETAVPTGDVFPWADFDEDSDLPLDALAFAVVVFFEAGGSALLLVLAVIGLDCPVILPKLSNEVVDFVFFAMVKSPSYLGTD